MEELTASMEEVSAAMEQMDQAAGSVLTSVKAMAVHAKDGEAGKGFAVVAEEIRVLADNSRDTANNIQSII